MDDVPSAYTPAQKRAIAALGTALIAIFIVGCIMAMASGAFHFTVARVLMMVVSVSVIGAISWFTSYMQIRSEKKRL